MADKKQLKRLKKDVDGWNKWREENPDVEINLNRADLIQANLSRADLYRANLAEADLEQANLNKADLREANLSKANLIKADLSNANLMRADLWKANLRGADLKEAILFKAELSKADFGGVDLYGASLIKADLSEVQFYETKFRGALLGGTFLGDTDLSNTEGLDEVIHRSPSIINTKTLQHSKGKIPEKFLRGCGLSDLDIEYAKIFHTGLSAREINDIVNRIYNLRATQSIQINTLFISYSHADGAFVDKMEKHLNGRGIRFWRDIHDATAGRLEKVVDRAMRQNPIVLLVLSEHSVKSDWVEHEARSARELEKELGRDVLCPVALDDAWKDCMWPERLREQIMEYNILDFSKWQDEGEFGERFRKLIDGLDLFYKQE